MPRGFLVAAHALPDAALALCRIMPPRQRGGFFHEEPPMPGLPLSLRMRAAVARESTPNGSRRAGSGAEQKMKRRLAHAKKALARGRKSLMLMVGRAGIEPATLCLKGRYSTY